jgi:uncharacterized protein involved in tolerance to divalent cations
VHIWQVAHYGEYNYFSRVFHHLSPPLSIVKKLDVVKHQFHGSELETLGLLYIIGNMKNIETIFVNIPCPTKKEAKKLCSGLLKKNLCGTAKIFENTHMMWMEKDKIQGEDVVIMVLKTTSKNLMDIHAFILENHSWGTPCIEVVPLVNDMC